MPQKTDELRYYWVYCATRIAAPELYELMKQPDFDRRWQEKRGHGGLFGVFTKLDEEHAQRAEQFGFISRFRAFTNPAFISAREFFSGPTPIETPFSVVYSNPLRVGLDVKNQDDLTGFNLALDEELPLRWFRSGPKQRPCYLFGAHLWELKPSELAATDREVRLLHLAAVKKERAKFERLEQTFSADAERPTREPIPESIQVLVWQRDKGKCVKCDSQERLEYDHIIPLSRGGSNTARNIQLLCERCNREKGNRF